MTAPVNVRTSFQISLFTANKYDPHTYIVETSLYIEFQEIIQKDAHLWSLTHSKDALLHKSDAHLLNRIFHTASAFSEVASSENDCRVGPRAPYKIIERCEGNINKLVYSI